MLGARPIDRFLKWGNGEWGMVFGEPDDPFFGSPIFIEPIDKERWERVLSGQFEGEADERGPEWFERVRKGR